MSNQRMHFNWDGVRAFCGRKLKDLFRTTDLAMVTCKACLRVAAPGKDAKS